jgi:hypothetical protein
MTAHLSSYPERRITLSPDNVNRFWEKVDKSPGQGKHGDCWLWTGCVNEHGYGVITMSPHHFLANRASWLIEYGSLPEGKIGVLHHCDTPRCVRPEHLFLGNQKVNLDDAISKGRMPILVYGSGVRGEEVGNHKLTAEEVLEIRALFGSSRKGYRVVAERYGVHRTLIGLILHRKIWKHI